MSAASVAATNLWVPAAPFRSYVLHLMESSRVPWRVIAQRAGVSAPVVRTLLFGRDGRPRRRLDRHSAAGLLAVTPAELDALRHLSLPAGPLRVRLQRLRAHGLSRVGVAHLLGSDAESVRRWEDGSLTTCSGLVDARARAAVAALDEAAGGRSAW